VIRECLLGIAWFAATPAVAPAWAADAIEALDIKPGLWQITLTVRTSGLLPMPPDVLAKLTPEERARIEAKAKERAAEGPRISVKRSCLEERELHQPLMFTFGGESQGCRQTVTAASRTRQEIRVDCGKGVPRGGGTVRIEAMDPENVKVTSSWSATDGARTMKMSSTATLKWLGAVCELDLPAAPKALPPPPAPKATPPPAVPKATPPPPAAAIPATADAGYYYKLGREQAGRNDLWGALRSLNRAIELDPQRATSYNARGYVYLRLQSFANAIVEFSNAIRLRPDYTNAYRNRAIARQHVGDEKGAAEDNRKAAELENRRLRRRSGHPVRLVLSV
jgi:tetratricopeptide (TPR) repeat protein